jgi:hypothetical protein
MNRPRDGRTLDLFENFYPVRRPSDEAGEFASDAWLRHAMSQALKECTHPREHVAAEMGRLLGDASMSLHMLNRYTAESAENGRISVIRFLAFIKITGAAWLLDRIAEPLGCIVMEGEEALLAERGRVRQQIDELKAHERALAKVTPTRVARRLR